VPVLAVYLCPSSVRVVATFSGTVLFPHVPQVSIAFNLSDIQYETLGGGSDYRNFIYVAKYRMNLS